MDVALVEPVRPTLFVLVTFVDELPCVPMELPGALLWVCDEVLVDELPCVPIESVGAVPVELVVDVVEPGVPVEVVLVVL